MQRKEARERSLQPENISKNDAKAAKYNKSAKEDSS